MLSAGGLFPIRGRLFVDFSPIGGMNKGIWGVVLAFSQGKGGVTGCYDHSEFKKHSKTLYEYIIIE